MRYAPANRKSPGRRSCLGTGMLTTPGWAQGAWTFRTARGITLSTFLRCIERRNRAPPSFRSDGARGCRRGREVFMHLDPPAGVVRLEDTHSGRHPYSPSFQVIVSTGVS